MKENWGSKRLPEYLTKQEIEEFLSIAYNYSEKHGMVFEFMWLTALRSFEVAKIKLEDIDLENRIVRVVQGKGGRDRLVPISARYLEKLQDYMKRKGILDPGRIIFPASLGTQRRWCRTHRALTSYAWKNLPHPHTFRHSFAVYFLKSAQTKHLPQAIEALRKILGHTSIATTGIYLNFLFEDVREVYDGVFS